MADLLTKLVYLAIPLLLVFSFLSNSSVKPPSFKGKLGGSQAKNAEAPPTKEEKPASVAQKREEETTDVDMTSM